MTPPHLLRLHHVGIVLPDMESVADYLLLFGQREAFRGHVPAFECWCIFLEAPPGQPAVELVIPTGGPLARFNRGAGGLHHHAFETADVRALQVDFAARGITMLREEPVKGAGDFLCNFLHPVATRGLIVEYVQPF